MRVFRLLQSYNRLSYMDLYPTTYSGVAGCAVPAGPVHGYYGPSRLRSYLNTGPDGDAVPVSTHLHLQSTDVSPSCRHHEFFSLSLLFRVHFSSRPLRGPIHKISPLPHLCRTSFRQSCLPPPLLRLLTAMLSLLARHRRATRNQTPGQMTMMTLTSSSSSICRTWLSLSQSLTLITATLTGCASSGTASLLTLAAPVSKKC